uniref:F-box protein 39 n=1 Tax=Seriola lalandi dorsalis TaxID=1841481 RepID=A0A3B4XZ37_SERLL
MHREESTQRVDGWASLPDVCLRHVFTFLPDHDRRSADMVCHHWHNVMRSPSLWRYRFFHFNGRLSKFRQSEYCSAVTYARYLGPYLERLDVCHPNHIINDKSFVNETLFGLRRVRAPLRSLSIVRLELNRSAWTLRLRNSLANCLIDFLRRGLLSALSHSQSHLYPRCYISSLDLVGFFSGSLHVYQDSSVPSVLCHLQGLTNLSLSYSCLSDELLMALRQSRNSSRDGDRLQTFSLHCSSNESHRQVVCGNSWAALASTCPDLTVKLTVDQVINTDRLARILQREIPLTEYSMTAFYSPDDDWSPVPLLCNLLPQYRRSLQFLTLDLSNCNESLDEELLELVQVCERLEQLRIWAFLEIRTVGRLLHIRLTQRTLLNKIRVRNKDQFRLILHTR